MCSKLFAIIVFLGAFSFVFSAKQDNHCQEDSKGEINAINLEEIDMNDYQVPSDFVLEEAVYNITKGSGYVLIKRVFSQEDISNALAQVMMHNELKWKKEAEEGEASSGHYNYPGLLWDLLKKGKIFEKLVQHPTILALSRKILGPNCQLSGITANTVLPGMEGQQPHLDHPYYEHLFFPQTEEGLKSTLSLTFATLLTDFTPDNGGTSVNPGSQLRPRLPVDPEEFFQRAVQVEGQPGDVFVIPGNLQHCAMPNRSRSLRAAVLQQMTLAYVKPFEIVQFEDDLKERASADLLKILGLNVLTPIKKNQGS